MHTYQLVVPRQDKDVYTASYAPGTSEFLRSDLDQQRTLHIDRYSGVIRKDLRYADFNPVSKMVTLGVALHMGEYFGLVNQLICAAISLSLLGLCMTGFVMWWWRRPRGALGAPQRVLQAPPSLRRWQAYLAALGILFPLMGATMLLVWGRRSPVLRQADLSDIRFRFLCRAPPFHCDGATGLMARMRRVAMALIIWSRKWHTVCGSFRACMDCTAMLNPCNSGACNSMATASIDDNISYAEK